MMSLTGGKNSGHIRTPISPVDQVTGMHAFSGILATLLQREKTGIGTYIETSLFETAVFLLNHPLQSYWERGVQPDKWGSSHKSLCPYQAFEASDGPVMIGVANDNLWRKFCKIADLEDIVSDPRFSHNAGRAEHRNTVVKYVQDKVINKTVAYWVEVLTSIGVPVASINTLEQMLAIF